MWLAMTALQRKGKPMQLCLGFAGLVDRESCCGLEIQDLHTIVFE